MTMCVTWAQRLKVMPSNDNVCHLSTASESDAPPNDNVCHLSTESESDSS